MTAGLRAAPSEREDGAGDRPRGRGGLLLLGAFAAGLVGAAVALVLAVSLDLVGEGGTTTIGPTAQATLEPLGGGTGVVAEAGALDAPTLYRTRAAGVVTIIATVAGQGITGSGFVVGADGVVITNAHVITDSPDRKVASAVRPASTVFVRFASGSTLPATIVGYDLFTDIGVLRLDDPPADLTVLSLGDADTLQPGDPLAVIGSPFGEEQGQSLSLGVVSALGRSIQPPAVDFETAGVIQTDAAINHGNSGGPVFDASGDVVGVAAQIESTSGGGEGVGFAVPAWAVRMSLEQLLRNGTVRYAWLGVSTTDVTSDLAARFGLPVAAGLLLDDVTTGGPAARAGFTIGGRTERYAPIDRMVHLDADLIVALDGKPVATSGDLARALADHRPGEEVGVDLYRGGARQTIHVVLGQRPANVAR